MANDHGDFKRSEHWTGQGPAVEDRCLVAPSPELREQLKEEFEEVRSNSSAMMGMMLRPQPRSPIGMNDGLIYPGDTFPLGTGPVAASRAAADRTPLRGAIRVIVVLAEFSDRALTHSEAHFEDLFFSEGELPNGSVKEYFHEVSNGMVDIVGQVAGPYTLPRSMAEYANGESGTGQVQPNARTMARDAAEAADTEIDFGPFDNEADGFVDAFIVIHAGPGAERTGDTDHIWSHKWVLPGGALEADGAKIYAYLTVPEDARIGVCCHELGHLLFGFPDLYDTDYSSEGVGNWCLMGGGSWLGGGEIPAHPSAWCKVKQGWAEVMEPRSEIGYQIEDVKSTQQVLRLWKNGSAGHEYFLVENRQKTAFDRELPAEGLLVWHIDDSIPGNSNEFHPKVALVQSDGEQDLEKGNNRGDAGDPFPGSAGKLVFTGTSTPSSMSYGDRETCVSLENISPSGPIMTADVTVVCEADGISWWDRLLQFLRSLFGGA